MRPAKPWSTLLLLAATAVICGAWPTKAGAQTTPPLTAGTWRLEAYGSAASPTPLLQGTVITATFGAAAGMVSGTAGCNSYSGGFTVEAEQMSVGTLAATQRACAEPAGIMEQEGRYLALLDAAARYRILGHTLEIVTTEGAVLRYARLEGTSWLLEALGDPNNPAAVLRGTVVTATFGDQTPAQVSGSGGCNSYFAGYRLEGETLAIGMVGSTRRFCAEPAGTMDQESRYFTLLQAAERYRVTARALEIVTKEGMILRYAAVAPSGKP
jgi:heat shock protein HslJ